MKKFLIVSFSSVILVSGLLGSAFVWYRAYEESERNRKISEEIHLLEEEANRIDQENRKLRDRIEYLQSDSFREREAKRVLEYQKSGEKVIFIRERAGISGQSGPSNVSPDDTPIVLGASEEVLSNPRRWWREFFEREEIER